MSRNGTCVGGHAKGVEIQGNLTFSPGTTVRQTETRGASMVSKVHARRMVLEGVS